MKSFKPTSILFAALVLQWSPALADEAITNVMSPIVSYQYPDDFSSQGLTNGGISSPIISYQYFEWPGDDVLHLNSSPWVSYFYNVQVVAGNVALHGRVLDAAGIPVSGATVSVDVFGALLASVETAMDGTYNFPAIPSGIYALTAAKPTFVADKRVVPLSLDLAQQDFRIQLLPSLPSFQVAGSTPQFNLSAPDDIHGAVLRVFDGTSFTSDLSLVDPAKMTVVLTHGWIPCEAGTAYATNNGVNDWPLHTAKSLLAQAGLSSSVANIVAWRGIGLRRHALVILAR